MGRQTALITGGAGQDGWYLGKLLLSRGYEVHAQSRAHAPREGHETEVVWHIGDVRDAPFLERVFADTMPSEVYNLAAVARPVLSWSLPVEAAETNAIFPLRLCELIRRTCPETRLFQASSSEIFGPGVESTQSERSGKNARSPYGIAKAYAHAVIGAYRLEHGLHLSSGILFNHESPRRPLGYVSQKIAHAAAAIGLGLITTNELDERGRPIVEDGRVTLGNIYIRRDFGFAGDYVEAMHAIIRADAADDYVIGTGETHSIAEFCEAAFRHVGRDWREHVSYDRDLTRKTDANSKADPSKLFGLLGRRFNTDFNALVAMMVEARTDVLAKSSRL